MTRRIALGDVWIDQFPVWNATGTGKVTGETVFTVTVWRDTVVDAIVPTITEIDTSGEYKIEYTPDQTGVWKTEVGVPANGDFWQGEAEVEKPELRHTMTAADDGTTVVFGVWARLGGDRLTDLTQISAQVKDTQGNIIVDMGTQATDTADGVFRFTTTTASLTSLTAYVLEVVAVRNGITWTDLLGLAGA